MSDVKLRVALLGAGRIGQEHSRTLIADPRVQVVAVCDPRLGVARQMAATIPGATATDESREILSSSGVDAIIICTPTDTHAELIEEGAHAHKAVFCEKPVALDLQRTKQALQVVEESGVPFQIGFQRRFDSGYAEARKRISQGLLGRIDQFRAVGRDPDPPPKEYLAKSGGLFLDQAIHEFDLARFLVGEVQSVFAAGVVRFHREFAACRLRIRHRHRGVRRSGQAGRASGTKNSAALFSGRRFGTRSSSFLYGSFPRCVSRRAGGFFYRGVRTKKTYSRRAGCVGRFADRVGRYQKPKARSSRETRRD